VHVLDEQGKRVWRGACASHPAMIEATIRQHAPEAVRIGLETGPLTTWLWQALTEVGLPMACLDARQAQAALNMRINKTDDNDAEGLAHLVRSGWYREVRVKSRAAMITRSLLGARTQLLGIVTELSNQIRGLMKTLVVPKGAGKIFEANVRRLLEGEPAVAAISLPLLESWRAVRAAELDRQLLAAAREVSPADDRPRRRRRRRGVLRGRHRDAGSLQEITRRRRLDRLDATALPVGRG
jgi:transposase